MMLSPAKALCGVAAIFATTIATTRTHHDPRPAATREVIAVYVGAEGTDGGMTPVVASMQAALRQQATAGSFRFLSRGVSIEPTVQDGLRHLARLGTFDELSVGDNWGNSAVVRYLGGESKDSVRSIPQVVLVEREARVDARTIEFGPERVLGRYIGVDVIEAWVKRGAPINR
jgi:hypothetical protein